MYKVEKDSKQFINHEKYCKGCGLCVEVCPQKCLKLTDKRRGVYGNKTVECDVEKCVQCKICERICPDGAIKIGK